MKRDPTDAAFDELLDYLKLYSIAGPTQNAELIRPLKTMHRKVLPLLLWQHHLGALSVFGEDVERNANLNDYFGEAVSDVSQASLLVLHGMLKPAYLILRSAIENYIRCMAIIDGADVFGFKTVYALMDTVGSSTLIGLHPEIPKYFGRLRQEYASLCDHVHTSGREFMTLAAAYSELTAKPDTKHLATLSAITDCAEAMTIVTTLCFRSQFFAHLHTKERDQILEALPATVRRAVMVNI